MYTYEKFMKLERARSLANGLGPETLVVDLNNLSNKFDKLAKEFATWHVPSSDPEVIRKLSQAGLTVSPEPLMPPADELERVWRKERQDSFVYEGRRYRRLSYTSRIMRNTILLSKWRDSIVDGLLGSFNKVFWESNPDTWATPQSWRIIVFQRL